MSPTIPIRERRGYAYYDTVEVPAGVFESVVLFEGRAMDSSKSLAETNMHGSNLPYGEFFAVHRMYIHQLGAIVESDLYQLKNDCYLALFEGGRILQDLPAGLAFGDGFRCDVPIPIMAGAPLRVRISPTRNVIIAEPVKIRILLSGEREA